MEIVLLKLSCVWFSTSCATYTRFATPLTMETEIIPVSRGYFIISSQHEAITYCVKYRVIRKSLRDFRPLRYSSRDGHAEGECVNRGRDTPSFCPTLQCSISPPLVTRQMSIL